MKKGNWEKAHDLAQDEGVKTEIGYMLISIDMEGDIGNAAYWYNRAGIQPVKKSENLEKEWEELVEFFLTQSGV